MGAAVRAIPTLLVIAGVLVCSSCGPSKEHSANVQSFISQAILTQAQSGAFRPPPTGHSYQGPATCRLDSKRTFRGVHLYLCTISISGSSAQLREYGAWLNGSLHTHATDPTRIPAATNGTS